jgi:glucosylceramidase
MRQTGVGIGQLKKESIYIPKYVPVFRYARDIIGCLNNWVDGWVDWNMVSGQTGRPKLGKKLVYSSCNADVDPDKDEVYFTPLYYTIAHFSKFIRPGAFRIDFACTKEALMVTAAENPDGSIAVVIFNPQENPESIRVLLHSKSIEFNIREKAIQTLLIAPEPANSK